MGDRGRPWAVKSVGSQSLIASAIDSCYSMHCKYAMFQPWATVGDRGRSHLLVHGHLLPQQKVPATVCVAGQCLEGFLPTKIMLSYL